MDQSYLAKIRAQVAEELTRSASAPQAASHQTTVLSSYGPYYEAAAVLSTFDSKRLKPAGTVTTDESIDDVLADSVLFRDAQRNSRWALLPEVRQDVLRHLGTREAMRRALAANPERSSDPLQSMLEAYIRGDAPEVERQDAQQISGTFQVIQWLGDVLPDLPSKTAVRQRQEKLALLQPFVDLAGSHFQGRVVELQTLREYVGVLPPGSVRERVSRIAASIFNFREKPLLVIHGPGGSGKSSLVARFILEHGTLAETERFPWVYIDFDRPGLQAEEPLTLLIEAVRQLGLQYPEVQEFCDRVRTQWSELLRVRRSSQVATAQQTAEVYPRELSKEASGPEDWHLFLRDFASLLNNLKLESDPLLFVLDTFEEVQYRSHVVVESLCRFLALFQMHVPRLRCVLAGRAPIKEVDGFPTWEIELKDFDPMAAQGFLEAHGVTPSPLAKAIVAQVGGNPLSLNLALEVWRKEGADQQGIRQLRTRRLLGFRVRENEIQGQLFTRILSHIHDPDVCKLAYPGLILRRVTPEVIREVMAEPCDVRVETVDDAQRLFEEMKREAALVTIEEGALRHRSDVRLLMLPLLREAEAKKIRRIEEAAVAYYEKQETVIARGEEIYHRLSLQQPLAMVEKRWQEGVQTYLFRAREELSMRERVWLSTRLGLTLSDQERAQAALAEWERDTGQRVGELLERKQAERSLAALHERKERLPGSPLYLLEARAWEQQENWLAAQQVIADGLVSAADAGNRQLAIELRLKGVRVDLRLHEYAAAVEKLDEAETLLDESGAPFLWMEVGLLRLSLYRAEPHDAQALVAVRQQLRERFDRLCDDEVIQQPALMAWLAAELGVDHPAVLRRVIRLIGLETPRQTSLRTLGRALAKWDSEVSKEAGASPGIFARRLDLSEDAASLTDTWTQFVLRLDRTALAPMIERLLESAANPLTAVLTTLVDIVRERARDLVPPLVESTSQGSRKSTRTKQVALSGSIRASSSMQAEASAEYTQAALHRLSARQRQQFCAALLSAFDRQTLTEMLLYRLDRSLDSLVLTDDFRSTIVQLVEISEREGWSAQLLAAARESRPDNSALFAFAAQFGLASVRTLSKGKLEQVIKTTQPFTDPHQWRSQLGRLETRVCRVEVGGPSPSIFGTGFLVGPDVLLTNYNVIEDVITGKVSPREVAFRFDYKRLDDGVTVNEGTVYRLAETEWLIDYSPYSEADALNDTATLPLPDELDYALVRVSGAPGAQPVGGERAELSAQRRGWVDIPTTAVEIHPNTALIILHHPEAGPLQVSIETEGLIGLNDNLTRVMYKADTAGGSAGAPCFNSNWELVAIHHSRSGVGCEGIPLAAIVNLLDQRGKKHVLQIALP